MQHNKKLLILTEAMMPFCSDWGSCQRVYHYSLKLVEEGYDVHIICRNFSENLSGTVEVKRIKVTTPDPPKISSNGNKSLRSRAVHLCKRNALLLAVMRMIYRFAYSEPNVFRGKESKQWAEKNKGFIREYICKENIGLVVVSGPPFGLFYLADELKQQGVKLVLDYRDPWNLWYEKFSLAEKYERQAVEASDLIIASTQSLSNALRIKYKKDDIYPVLNGYDILSWENQEKTITDKKHQKLVISYVGYISVNNPPAFRDPRCFIETACDFLESKDDVEIKFIGVGDDLATIKDRYKSKISFKNRVPVEDALREVNNSDVVLVMHTANDSSGNFIVCGKLYDYLRSGKYILSVGNKARCNNDLIDQHNSGIHCNNDRQSILNCLELIYRKWKEDLLHVNIPDDIYRYSRDFQNTEFVKMLNDIK